MTVAESLPVKREKYDLVPPDGGYGYVILFAVTVNLTASISMGNSFGLIYNDFFEELEMSSTSITLLTGTTAICCATSEPQTAGYMTLMPESGVEMQVEHIRPTCTSTTLPSILEILSMDPLLGSLGFLTGPLMKKMSMRKLSFLGTVFFNAGALGTVFVNSQAPLIFCLGVLQSFGLGILFNLSCTAINDYFIQKRLFATSLVQTISAAAAMVWPVVIGRASEQYGFRGKLILVAAVAAQAFVGTALLQPVAWHMKKVIKEKTGDKLDKESDIPEKHLLLEHSHIDKHIEATLTPIISLSDVEDEEYLFPPGKNIYEKSAKDNTLIMFIKDFLDWQLFKRFVWTCGCLGAPTVIFADITFVSFFAQALYGLKWTEDGVALAFSLLGLGDIIARVFLMFFSSWLTKFGSHPVYVFGICIAIIIKIVLAWFKDYVATLVIITVLGGSRCVISVLYPLVVADAVKPEEFTSAMGISMMMYGLISLILGLISGAIRDMTGNYTTMFLILIGFKVVVVIAWTAELIVNRRRRSIALNNIQQTEKKEIN